MNLPAGSLVIYCADVKAKIAEVSIEVDDYIKTFSEYEKDNSDRLSGGHLAAQIKRFEGLWRLRFFIDEDVKHSLSEWQLSTLSSAIRTIVLGSRDNANMISEVQRFAKDAAHEAQSNGRNNVRYSAEILETAKSDPQAVEKMKYPNGWHVIRSFLKID